MGDVSGLPCRLEGSRLYGTGPEAQDLCIELAVAEIAVAELAGSSDQLAIAIVPFVGGNADTRLAAGMDTRVMGWVFLCYSDELETSLASLYAAGCVCNDLSSACDVRQQDVLGSGSFSTVVRARGVSGCDVAVKRVSVDGDGGAVLSEVSCLVDVQPHPNVVRFHGLFACSSNEGPGGLAIVLDFAAGGDLFAHCTGAGRLSEGGAAAVLEGLLGALAHIHASGVLHRDVKPENVLLMADGRAVLADFGAAAREADKEQLEIRVGSLGYAAPEVLAGQSYGRPVDCFGAGGVLHFALSGSPPFESRTRQALVWKTCACRVDFEKSPWTGVSAECKDVLQQLLCRNPKERPTAMEAGKHKWLAAAQDASGTDEQDALFRKCVSLQNTFKAFCRLLPIGL